MKRITATGDIENGVLTLQNQGVFDAQLIQMSGTVLVTVERLTRTQRQNAFYHVWNGIIERELGWNAGDAHEWNKLKCNPKVLHTEMGGLHMAEEEIIGASTANLSIDAFAEYLERVRVYWAVEHGIELPDAKQEDDHDPEQIDP
jgi:hypothetical protein